MGSALGNPLFTDECTANKLRVSYARILVEIDVTQKQKEYIIIKDTTENKKKQIVEYEWSQPFVKVVKRWGTNAKSSLKSSGSLNLLM